MWAVGGGLPGAVPDGVLGLHREEEHGHEAVSLGDAGTPVLLRHGSSREVAVRVADHVVNNCRKSRDLRSWMMVTLQSSYNYLVLSTSEHDPGAVEAAGKKQNHVGPGGVEQRGVEVGDVAPPLLRDVLIVEVSTKLRECFHNI